MTVVDAFAEQLRHHFGIVYPPARDFALRHALDRLVAEAKVDAPDVIVALLDRGDRRTLELAARVCTVGETYFFRETAALLALRKHLEQRAADPDPVRLWSAACSTGEEAYSLAMVAREVLGPRPLTVLATDINLGSIARAIRGRYRQWSFRGVSDEVRANWFIGRQDGTWEVRPDVRGAVTFAPFNLVRDETSVEHRGFDAIFCCNALLYFPPDVVQSVGDKLIGALRPDGWLFLAATDPALGGQEDRRAAGPAHAYAAQPTAQARPRSAPPAPPEMAPLPSRPKPRRKQRDRAPSPAAVEAPAQSLGSDPKTFVVRAAEHAERGNTDAALGDLRRALYLDPTLAIAHALTGAHLVTLGRLEPALRALTRARMYVRDLDAQAPVPAAAPLTKVELLAMVEGLERAARRGKTA